MAKTNKTISQTEKNLLDEFKIKILIVYYGLGTVSLFKELTEIFRDNNY